MQSFAGPICDGLTCAPLQLLVLLPLVAIGLILFGIYKFASKARREAIKAKKSTFAPTFIMVSIVVAVSGAILWESVVQDAVKESKERVHTARVIPYYDYRFDEYKKISERRNAGYGYMITYRKNFKTEENNESADMEVTQRLNGPNTLKYSCGETLEKCEVSKIGETQVYYRQSKSESYFVRDKIFTVVRYTHATTPYKNGKQGATTFKAQRVPDSVVASMLATSEIYRPSWLEKLLAEF